jgi:hypothetical protein
MKRIIIALLLTAFCAASGFAQNKTFTGKDWLALTKNDRLKLVSDFIRDVKKDGVMISNGATYYCKRMDGFYAKNPDVLKEPAGKILKTLMIMEYDWKIKGADSDTIAKSWLSEKLYKDNKSRLSKK